MDKIAGKILKLGDDVNTDLIIPGHYLSIHDPRELAKHIFEDLEIDFPSKLRAGCNLILAGSAFGSGSSREQAVTGLKAAGIKAILAKSFGRIFYRNAINEGIPVVECPEVYEVLQSGDDVEIDLEGGKVLTRRGEFHFHPWMEAVREILQRGGLTPYVKAMLKKDQGTK